MFAEAVQLRVEVDGSQSLAKIGLAKVKKIKKIMSG
jgi:hypothetical protein